MKQSSNSCDNSKTPCLHDCIALGQLEEGLSTTSIEPRSDELARLPTLLRLLSTCRPLVSVTTTTTSTKSKDDDDDNYNNNHTVSTDDDNTLTRTVSQRLEDRAAMYSSAESVEVVACHLAPAVCRKVSRWKQLEEVVVVNSSSPTMTTMPTTSPSSLSTSKRRKVAEGTTASAASASTGGGGIVAGAIPQQDDVLQALSEDEGMNTTTDRSEDEGFQEKTIHPQKRKRTSDPQQFQQILIDTGNVVAATTATATATAIANNTDTSDDSAEATATKMLHELILLVQPDFLAKKSTTSIDDFVLAQETTRQPATGQCDLGAILVSLMHHAPILKHEQVAVCIQHVSRDISTCVTRW